VPLTLNPVTTFGALVGRDLDPSIEEAVFSLCYAAPRVEVPELASVRDQLLAKYGKQMEQKTGGGKDKVSPGQSTAFVNARVRHHIRSAGDAAPMQRVVTPSRLRRLLISGDSCWKSCGCARRTHT